MLNVYNPYQYINLSYGRPTSPIYPMPGHFGFQPRSYRNNPCPHGFPFYDARHQFRYRERLPTTAPLKPPRIFSTQQRMMGRLGHLPAIQFTRAQKQQQADANLADEKRKEIWAVKNAIDHDPNIHRQSCQILTLIEETKNQQVLLHSQVVAVHNQVVSLKQYEGDKGPDYTRRNALLQNIGSLEKQINNQRELWDAVLDQTRGITGIHWKREAQVYEASKKLDGLSRELVHLKSRIENNAELKNRSAEKILDRSFATTRKMDKALLSSSDVDNAASRAWTRKNFGRGLVAAGAGVAAVGGTAAVGAAAGAGLAAAGVGVAAGLTAATILTGGLILPVVAIAGLGIWSAWALAGRR